MKKQKSTTLNISEVSSSDDESQIAKAKKDKEDLGKCLKDDYDESSQDQITPKSSPQIPLKVKRLKASSPVEETPFIETKKVNKSKQPQETSKNNVVKGKAFLKLQKSANNLGATSLQYSKRKNTNTWLSFMEKRFTLVLPKQKTLSHIKTQLAEKSISTKPRKFQTKMENLHTKIPLIQIIGLSNF